MPFRYSKFLLERIAKSYEHIYDRIVLDSYTVVLDGSLVEREWSIRGERNLIEYKVDFDRALEHLGQSRHLSSLPKFVLAFGEFKLYSHFSRLQQIVIADILDIPEEELAGFYDISRLRSFAYGLMARYLNKGN